MKGLVKLTILWGAVFACAVVLANPMGASAKSIGKNDVNIHSRPSLRSRVLFEAPLGYPIEIERVRGNWVFFRDWAGDTGWVYKPLVSNIDTAVVLVKIANLRSGPGIRHKIVGEAKEGQIYKIIGKDGRWCRLGLYYGGNPVGWISSKLIFGN